MQNNNRNSTEVVEKSSLSWSSLIAEIRKYPQLWNENQISGNRLEWFNAWDKLVKKLRQPRDLLLSKWRYLRLRYKKELQLEIQNGPQFKSQWYLFDQMHFVRSYVTDVIEKIENSSQTAMEGNELKMSSKKLEYWTRLLEEVRIRPAIWDKSHADKCVRCIINRSWEQIGKACKQPSDLCRRDFHYLKHKYKLYLKLQSTDVPQPKTSFTPLYNQMAYMKHCIIDTFTEPQTPSSGGEVQNRLENDPLRVDLGLSGNTTIIKNEPLDDDVVFIKTEPFDETKFVKQEEEEYSAWMSEENARNINPSSNDSNTEAYLDLESSTSSPSSDISTTTSERKLFIYKPKVCSQRANHNLNLILQVKKRPVLWDTDHPLHRNRVAMNEKWDEVAKFLGQTKDDTRKQWYYMTVKYKQQLREELLLAARNNLKCEVYFQFYEVMSFLRKQSIGPLTKEINIQHPETKSHEVNPTVKIVVRVENSDGPKASTNKQTSLESTIKKIVSEPQVSQDIEEDEVFEYFDVVDEGEQFEYLEVVDDEEFNPRNVKEEPPEIISDYVESKPTAENTKMPRTIESAVQVEPAIDVQAITVKEEIKEGDIIDLDDIEDKAKRRVGAQPKGPGILEEPPLKEKVVDMKRDSPTVFSELDVLPPFKKIKLTMNSQAEVESSELGNKGLSMSNHVKIDSNKLGDEDFFKNLIPLFRHLTEPQKIKLRNLFRNMIVEEILNNIKTKGL